MEELLIELKPKYLNENELFEIQKKKKLYKNIWKFIGITILVCIIIVGIFEGSTSGFVIISQYLLVICFISALILFFPTMINLNFFVNGSSINRNDCYIRVYNDRIECYQILASLAREKECAILYYDEMKSWSIKHRMPTSENLAKARNVDCIQINMDTNMVKSKFDHMNMYMFYIEMAGYDKKEFMQGMKIAFDKANEYRKVTYHTHNSDYNLE